MGTRNSSVALLLLFISVSLSVSLSVSVSSTLPSEFSILGDQETNVLSSEKITELFRKWKEMHGKTYAHEEEEARRLGNFRKSLKYILEKNSKRKSETEHMVGLNKFADLSNEEFKEMYFSKVRGPRSNKLKMRGAKRNTTLSSKSCDAPASLDWRDKGIVTPIKDQGQCGKHLIPFSFIYIYFYISVFNFLIIYIIIRKIKELTKISRSSRVGIIYCESPDEKL